jgi:hypothetical protein
MYSYEIKQCGFIVYEIQLLKNFNNLIIEINTLQTATAIIKSTMEEVNTLL